MEFIQYAKTTRQFAKIVRDGIRLIWSLREGDMTVLFELFPHLEKQFNPDVTELITQFSAMMLQHSQVVDAAPRAIPATVGEGHKPAPVPESKQSVVMDASAIADNFLNFIQ